MPGKNNAGGYFFRLLVIMLLVLLACMLPRIFFSGHGFLNKGSARAVSGSYFKLGLENTSPELLKSLTQSFKARVGLITNHAAVDQKGRRNIDLFIDHGVAIDKIFTPERDLRTHLDAQSRSSWYEYGRSKIPCTSFYSNEAAKEVNERALKTIDMIFFDMQDVGMRTYCNINMLLDALLWASRNKKRIVIFDRPNLLGNSIEGAWGTNATALATGAIPLRYGMTMAELADYFNKQFFADAIDVHVVPMKEYHRRLSSDIMMQLSHTIAPSVDSCLGYSFLSLLAEITPFDVGTATPQAFRCILLPEHMQIDRHKWFELRALLHGLGIESNFYRYYNNNKKQNMSGLQLSIADISNISTIKTLISVLTFFKNAGVPLHFSPTFDRLIGSTKMREYFQGRIDYTALIADANKELKTFFNKALNSFMYQPLPRLVMN